MFDPLHVAVRFILLCIYIFTHVFYSMLLSRLDFSLSHREGTLSSLIKLAIGRNLVQRKQRKKIRPLDRRATQNLRVKHRDSPSGRVSISHRVYTISKACWTR